MHNSRELSKFILTTKFLRYDRLYSTLLWMKDKLFLRFLLGLKRTNWFVGSTFEDLHQRLEDTACLPGSTLLSFPHIQKSVLLVQLLHQMEDMHPARSFESVLLCETSGNWRVGLASQLVLHNKSSLRCWELMIAAIVYWFRIGLTCHVETELRNDKLKTQVLRGNKMAGICSYSCTQSGAKSTGCPVFPVAKFWKLS